MGNYFYSSNNDHDRIKVLEERIAYLESLERAKPAANRTTPRSDDSEYDTIHTPIHTPQRNRNNNNMLQLRQELVKKIQARRTKIDPDVL